MIDFITEQFAQIDLQHTPLTRKLLECYVIKHYEGKGKFTEENLKAELIDLNKRGHLDRLIETQLNPITRELLENYITFEYEGTIELTDENLNAELTDLSERGHIGALISAEWVYSRTRFRN